MAEELQDMGAVDPWAQAFAALDKEGEEKAEEPSAPGGDAGEAAAPEVDGRQDADTHEEADGHDSPDAVGERGDLEGEDSGPYGSSAFSDLDVTEEDVKSYRQKLEDDVKDESIRVVAEAFIKQGARHRDGKLGAFIDDEDVCKRDRDGVPHFFNPETGREFTGDNPRRQAQEWCDDYNKQLADAFNDSCEKYSQKLMDERSASLKVMEFAPKYDKLDDVRKSMFESIIEDYEIKDEDGSIIGYSCDLDKALAAVNRQVKVIQQRFAGQGNKAAPTGPALDMPTGGRQQSQDVPEFHSVAEAMEWQQDQILKKAREGRR